MFILHDLKNDRMYCSYSIVELSGIVDKHPNTLRKWLKQPNNGQYRIYKGIILKSKQGGNRQ